MLGCFVVIWPDAKKCVDRGLWDKRIFEFRNNWYNTNPIIMNRFTFSNQFSANLYWVLGLFGKENVVHGMLQKNGKLPSGGFTI